MFLKETRLLCKTGRPNQTDGHTFYPSVLKIFMFFFFVRFTPYSQFEKCRICKTTVHQPHSKYCQGCAYKKGKKIFSIPLGNCLTSYYFNICIFVKVYVQCVENRY